MIFNYDLLKPANYKSWFMKFTCFIKEEVMAIVTFHPTYQLPLHRALKAEKVVNLCKNHI